MREGEEMNQDDLIEKLESTANFMRGMCFDPRLHPEIKEAVRERASDIDDFIEKYMDKINENNA